MTYAQVKICELSNETYDLGDCPVVSCSYNRLGTCKKTEIQELCDIPDLRERAEAVSSEFNISLDDLRHQIKLIQISKLASVYVEWLVDRPLLDIRTSDLEKIRKSESSYGNWNPPRLHGSKPSFKVILRVIEHIAKNL